EDDHLGFPRPGELGGPAADARAADHQRGRVPDHLERLGGVEGGVAVPLRGVDGELAGVEAQGKLVDERLDAAPPRREVVGDDQRASHDALQCRRDSWEADGAPAGLAEVARWSRGSYPLWSGGPAAPI